MDGFLGVAISIRVSSTHQKTEQVGSRYFWQNNSQEQVVFLSPKIGMNITLTRTQLIKRLVGPQVFRTGTCAVDDNDDAPAAFEDGGADYSSYYSSFLGLSINDTTM